MVKGFSVQESNLGKVNTLTHEGEPCQGGSRSAALSLGDCSPVTSWAPERPGHLGTWVTCREVQESRAFHQEGRKVQVASFQF